MFKTQPFQNFNVLFDAVGNYEAKVRHYNAAAGSANNYALPESRKILLESQVEGLKNDVVQAKTRLRNAISALLVSTLVFASMTFAYNMLRRKKDNYADEAGNVTLSKIAEGIGKDMAASLSGTMPFGSEAWELISSIAFGEKYYGLDSVTITALSDFVTAGKDIYTQVQDIIDTEESDKDNAYWQSKALKVEGDLDDILQGFGIPGDNVRKLFNIALGWSLQAKGEYLGEYEYLKFTRAISGNKSAYYDNLYEAYKNDKKQFRKIYADMVDMGFSENTIKDNMEKRMKQEQGVSSVKDLKERFDPEK